MTTKIEKLTGFLNSNLSSTKQDLDKFSERFAADPGYAFSWSENAFSAAAEAEVTSLVLQWVEDGQKVEDYNEERLLETMTRFASDEALRLAMRLTSSTSKSANLYDDNLRVAWVRMAKRLQDLNL